jgi:hypothetical protein
MKEQDAKEEQEQEKDEQEADGARALQLYAPAPPSHRA